MEFSVQIIGNRKFVFKNCGLHGQKSCGIYELKSESDRVSYKIFADQEDLRDYLKKNKGKRCEGMAPIFRA